MPTPFTIGLDIDGAGSHPAAWRDARHPPATLLSGRRVARVVQLAEAAGISYLTFAGSHLPPGSDPDIPARLDPVQQAAYAAPLTSRIGLIAEVPVTYLEPFHVATQLASIDHAAHDRAGWLVSAENSAAAAAEYGRTPLRAEELARETEDVVRVTRLLWDSWEDDAVIRDLPTGRYLDRDKVHSVDFVGGGFSVRGPAIVPRPPQGRLPVVVPVQHAEGTAADAVLVPAGDGLATEASRWHEAGRLVIADLEVALDSRGERGIERLARLDSRTPWPRGDAGRFAGSAPDLTALIVALASVVDGVRLRVASLDVDLDELRFAVLPVLIVNGVFRPPQNGDRLRTQLGLSPAADTFAGVDREPVTAGRGR